MGELDRLNQELQFIQGNDGLLIFGSSEALAELDKQQGLDLHDIAPRVMARAGGAANVVSQYQENSGRWLRLADESFDLVKKSKIDTKKIKSGVIRIGDIAGAKGNKGEIVKHLKFAGNTAVLASPAGLLTIAAALQESSMQAQIEKLEAYLETMDAKLDTLLQISKDELTGEISGSAEVLREALVVLETTGEIDDVTWSKIQGEAAVLLKKQGTILERLRSVARDLNKSSSHPDAAAEAFERLNGDFEYYLQQIARVWQLQNQAYVLEGYRVEVVAPERLEKHLEATETARAERKDRLAASLAEIREQARLASTFKNRHMLTSPINTNKAISGANEVFEDIEQFGHVASIDGLEADLLERNKMKQAFLGAVGDAKEAVFSAADAAGSVAANARVNVEEGVNNAREGLDQFRNQRRVARLDKLKEKIAKEEQKLGDRE